MTTIIDTQSGKRRIIEFDTVAEMVTARFLKIGDRTETKIYSTGFEGGSGYEIVAAGTGTADTVNFIDITGSSVQAVPIHKDRITPLDTVADLVAAPYIKIGDIIETSEYFTGTGGGNKYKIVASGTGTADGGAFINITGPSVSVQAQALWYNETIDIRQFGAKGDKVTDDTIPINLAVDKAVETGQVLVAPTGQYVTDPMVWPASISVRGDGAWTTSWPSAPTTLRLRREQNGAAMATAITSPPPWTHRRQPTRPSRLMTSWRAIYLMGQPLFTMMTGFIWQA